MTELPRSRSDASAQTAVDARNGGWACTPGQPLGGSRGPGSVSVGREGAHTRKARLQPGPLPTQDPDPELQESHLAGLARRALARSLSSEHGWPEAGDRAASPGPDSAAAPAVRARQQPGAAKRPVDVHFNPLFHSGEEEGVRGGSGAGQPGAGRGAAARMQERRDAGCGPDQKPWHGPAAGATPLSDALAAADVSEPLRRELLGLLERNLEEVQAAQDGHPAAQALLASPVKRGAAPAHAGRGGPARVAARAGPRTSRTCWRPRSCCWRASQWRASASSSRELHFIYARVWVATMDEAGVGTCMCMLRASVLCRAQLHFLVSAASPALCRP